MGVGVGGSGSEASVWLAGTSVVCRTIGGLPGTLRVVVTFGGDVGSGNEEYFVDRYVSGAARVKVAGTGEASVERRLWASDTSVVCRVGADVGETLGVVWTSEVKVVSLSGGTFYDGWSGSSLWRVSAGGSRNASVSGKGLGACGHSMRVGVGVSGSEASVWLSETSVVCRTGVVVSGSGGDLGTITVSGSSRVGMSSCAGSDWVSSSRVLCLGVSIMQGTWDLVSVGALAVLRAFLTGREAALLSGACGIRTHLSCVRLALVLAGRWVLLGALG